MKRRKGDRRFSMIGYPGDQYRHAICDRCGCKRFIKDMMYVDSKYNRLNGAFLCKEHYDPVQPQDVPYWIVEKQVDDPRYIRPRPNDQFVINANSNILPSAPQLLRAVGNPAGNGILLSWQGPFNSGSSGINGYQIQIEYPQGGAFSILIDNTNEPGTIYVDTISTLPGFYAYKVAAISNIGMGPFSEIYYFPSELPQNLYNFICTDSPLYSINTDIGDNIIMG